MRESRFTLPTAKRMLQRQHKASCAVLCARSNTGAASHYECLQASVGFSLKSGVLKHFRETARQLAPSGAKLQTL